jgi:hypothetical protein
MPECVADLRISASSESNDAPLDIGRGIKRKLDNSQEDQEKSQESERIENPSAPKRRRRSKEGIVYKAKSSISSLFQSLTTFFFGMSEEPENSSILENEAEKEPGQDQAVDMSRQGYNKLCVDAKIHKEGYNKDLNDIQIIQPNSSIGYTDNHQYQNAHENIFNQKEENSERRFTTSQKKIAMKRHNMPFGLQASGPLTSKTPIENFRFEGRQFAVATQEKRNFEKQRNAPSVILNQIRQKKFVSGKQ